MSSSDEIAWLQGYMPIVVRDGGITPFERSFCASMIRHARRGRVPSARQVALMRRIVMEFRERVFHEIVERRG